MTDVEIPFDPDFDEQKKTEIVGMSSRLMFIAGLVTSFLVLSTIGFIVLLVLSFR